MRIRIIAGELGGRYIDAPRGDRTRPTSERVREAWFSALGDRVETAAIADLFAGSGALGIEALSRGARSVHFVEADRRASAVLERNLQRLGLSGRATLATCDVFSFLEARRRGGADRFDIVLADPPYVSGTARRLVERFEEAAFADLLCVEHAKETTVCSGEPFWTRSYGDTRLTFLTAH